MTEFFSKAVQENRHVKCMAQGSGGTGKTFTSALLAMGAVEASGARGPVFYVDTEKGSDYVLRLFEERGIEVHRVRKEQLKAEPEKKRRVWRKNREVYVTSRSMTLRNLSLACAEAQRKGASAMIVDSLSWFWGELVEDFDPYDLSDWQLPKNAWRKCVEYLFVDAPFHVFACSRVGNDYVEEVNERSGKKVMSKVGLKAKADADTIYEPSLAFQMECRGGVHVAKIIKDRTFALPVGEEIKGPNFEAFSRVWDRMAWGSASEAPPPLEEEEEPEAPRARADLFESLELRPGWSWPSSADAYQGPRDPVRELEDKELGSWLALYHDQDKEAGDAEGPNPKALECARAGAAAGWTPEEFDKFFWAEKWEKLGKPARVDLRNWLESCAEARAKAFEPEGRRAENL